MKIRFNTLILSFLAIASTLAGCILLWLYQKDTLTEAPAPLNEARVSELINEFRVQSPALFKVEVPTGIDPNRPKELVDPKSMFPDPDRNSQLNLSSVVEKGESCNPQASSPDPGVRKLQEWYRYKCKAVSKLPESFWKSAPWIHPLGGSWAFWLFKNGYGDQNWLEAQAKFLHVLELRHLEPKKDATFLDKVLRDITPTDLDRLLKSAGLVLTPSYVLLSSYVSTELNSLIAFPRQSWDTFVATKGLVLSDSASANCETEKLSYCWDFVVRPSIKLNPKSLLLIMAILITFLSGIIFYVLWRRAAERDQFIENQQLLMQTLAHELRTPVTGLNLVVESIRGHFDELPGDSKNDFLRLASISDKMNRVIHFSSQYLAILRSEGEFKINPVVVESFNDLVWACLEEHSEKLEFSPLAHDVRAKLDPYWFSVCLGVLINNALNHGAQPVSIVCEVDSSDLILSVQDSGEGPSRPLSELVSPKVKHSVKGLGLGLSLINRIITQSGGKLSLTLRPTKFTIRFRGVVLG